MNPEDKPKTLEDVLYFNKWEERNRSMYAVAKLNETEAAHLEHVNVDELEIDEDDDEEVRAWK
jgi:hypothetical protein